MNKHLYVDRHYLDETPFSLTKKSVITYIWKKSDTYISIYVYATC